MAERNLTEGPVWRALTQVSAPMALGILAVLGVGLADAFFLGRLGGNALAAVGFIFPVTTAITSLSIGLSAGANTVVSQAIGREESRGAVARLALHALILGAGLSLLVALAFWAGHGVLFGLLGAREPVLQEISAYVPYWALSFPALVAMMIINAIFRAHGDGGASAMVMVLAAAVNIALDPVLIFGLGPLPELGTAGAGLATLVARLTAALAAGWLAWHRGILAPGGRPAKGLTRSARGILSVGVPAALSNAINPAGMAAVTAAVATVSQEAVAGFGAATRVQSLAIVAMLALSAGIGPVVGQNWGAGHQDRARRAVLLSWGFCVAYGLAGGALLFFFAGPIGRLIAGQPEAAEYTANYLRLVGWSLFGYGILVTANAAMNARDKALWSMGLSLGRILAVYLPFAWAGALTLGYSGILMAAVAANLAAVAGAVFACGRTGLLPRPEERGLRRAFS